MTVIKFRRDTSANWTSANPIPAQGEPCYETDTGKFKIGNGSDSYTALPYVSDGGSAADLPIASTTTLGGVKVGENLTITEDGTISMVGTIPTKTSQLVNDSGFLTEIPSNIITTSQFSTSKEDAIDHLTGVYKANDSTYVCTVQPMFDSIGGDLSISRYFYCLKAAYNATEPEISDMTSPWTNISGAFYYLNAQNYLESQFRLAAGTDTNMEAIYKFPGANRTPYIKSIETIDVTGATVASLETSTDGTTYTTFDSSAYNTEARYLKVTYHVVNSGSNASWVSPKIRINMSYSYANLTKDLVMLEGQNSVTTDMIDATYMKINDRGKLSVNTAAVAHLAMPSNTRVDLTLGASGTSYTAPADGYLFATVQTANSGGVIELAQTNGVNYYCRTYGTAQLSGNIPVSSGANVTFNYLSSNSATDKIGFTYCNGTVPAA